MTDLKTRAKQNVLHHRVRTRQFGAVNTLTVDEWLTILLASRGRCYYCHRRVGINHLTIDHKVSMTVGGDNTAENVVPACRRCNSAKRMMTESEFASIRSGNQVTRRDIVLMDRIKFAKLLNHVVSATGFYCMPGKYFMEWYKRLGNGKIGTRVHKWPDVYEACWQHRIDLNKEMLKARRLACL